MSKYQQGGTLLKAALMNWATPTTMDCLPPKSKEALHREATITRPGRTRPANLRDQVSNHMNWPTPTTADVFTDRLKSSQQKEGSMHSVNLSQAVRMFPTPIAGDWKGQVRKDRTSGMLSGYHITDGGQLNPDWVEWLMGFPVGWTDLESVEQTQYDWSREPDIPRVGIKIPNRKDRIMALGNAVVPQCAEVFAKALMEGGE